MTLTRVLGLDPGLTPSLGQSTHGTACFPPSSCPVLTSPSLARLTWLLQGPIMILGAEADTNAL